MNPIELSKAALLRHLRVTHGASVIPPDDLAIVSWDGKILRIEQADPAATPDNGIPVGEDGEVGQVGTAGDILALGLGLLGAVHGQVTGTLRSPGSASTTAYAGSITNQRRSPQSGQRDVIELELLIPAADVSIAPLADMLATITGDSATWLVAKADPVKEGDAVAAWRLRLVDSKERSTS